MYLDWLWLWKAKKMFFQVLEVDAKDLLEESWEVSDPSSGTSGYSKVPMARCHMEDGRIPSSAGWI